MERRLGDAALSVWIRGFRNPPRPAARMDMLTGIRQWDGIIFVSAALSNGSHAPIIEAHRTEHHRCAGSQAMAANPAAAIVASNDLL